MNGRQCTNVNNIKTFAVNSTDTVNENIVKIKIKKMEKSNTFTGSTWAAKI